MKILNKICSSIDDTIKYQFLTKDNNIIEACVIFFEHEIAPINICVSSQVGCACNCAFCATGKKRFVRNLSFEELKKQVLLIIRDTPQADDQLFEITYMGTGEPLNNFNEVSKSFEYFENTYNNLCRINISTIVPHLNIPKERLLTKRCPIHFQYSLHFTDDDLRKRYLNNKLVPICEALEFLNSLSNYTNEEFCVNYLLFDGLNDSEEDAKKLICLCNSLKSYIKVSEYCPIDGGSLRPSKNFSKFTAILDKNNIRWKPFQSKGVDIKASCGHLLSDINF